MEGYGLAEQGQRLANARERLEIERLRLEIEQERNSTLDDALIAAKIAKTRAEATKAIAS